MKNKHHMDCDDVELLLELWGDGELDAARGEQVRAHLLDCQACREAYRDHRNLLRWLVRPEVPAVPADFAERVVLAAARRDAVEGREPISAPAGGRDGGPMLRPLPPVGRPFTAAAGGGSIVAGESSVLPFVLACTAAAAALLLVLSIAIGAQERPGGDELRAEPLPSVLEGLERLRERDGANAPLTDPAAPHRSR